MQLFDIRTHNLRIPELSLPEGRLIVITGPSGSGKSSLAFDTLALEGRRRYLQALALSEEVRIPPPPELGEACGIPPTVALPQRIPPPNPRSTVGTVSGLLDGLRTLFAECGKIPCPRCGKVSRKSRLSEILALFASWPSGTRLLILAPLKHPSPEALSYLVGEGFGRFRIDGREIDLTEEELPEKYERVEVVVDRLIRKEGAELRFLEALRLAEGLSGGPVKIHLLEGPTHTFTLGARCAECLNELPSLSREFFSYNHPRGACPLCRGLGEREGRPCSNCNGLRLRPESLAVRVGELSVAEILKLPLGDLPSWLETLKPQPGQEQLLRPLLERIKEILSALCELGLEYLSLLSPFHRLSTGERKRVELSGLLSAGLSGCLFVLDEPSLGLSLAEREKLLLFLRQLVMAGNTVLVVEHDPLFIRAADLVVELGPGAGEKGGRLCFLGDPEELVRREDLPTGAFLSGRKKILRRRRRPSGKLRLEGLPEIFRGLLTVIGGASGSGKTRWLERIATALSRKGHTFLFIYGEIPGRPRGMVASFAGVFEELRRLMAETPEARAGGLKPAHFSPFSREGRCPVCRGEGYHTLRLAGVPESEIRCEECGGTGLKPEVLSITYRGYTFPEILGLTLEEALELLGRIPRISQLLLPLVENGLGYLRLGQPLKTLSGGEKLRLRLFRELASQKAEFLLLDLPSMGLHLVDLERMFALWERLLSAGHTLIVAENHPVVILAADEVWLLEKEKLIFRGPPSELLALEHPFTRGLSKYLSLVSLE